MANRIQEILALPLQVPWPSPVCVPLRVNEANHWCLGMNKGELVTLATSSIRTSERLGRLLQFYSREAA